MAARVPARIGRHWSPARAFSSNSLRGLFRGLNSVAKEVVEGFFETYGMERLERTVAYVRRHRFGQLASRKFSQLFSSQGPFKMNNHRQFGFFNSASQSSEKEQNEDEGYNLSRDELIMLVAEKNKQLKLKNVEIDRMQDKILQSFAEMENVIGRTKREAENSRKFAIQSFVKNLLDVADNLGRASSVVKDSFSKLDASKDSAGAVPLLKTLLEGVEMTDKQLAEVLNKSGVEKIDPLNEQFDPNKHCAVFQVPDPKKPPGIVATVLKPGYLLYDRVIRPAEVGVTVTVNNEMEESSAA